MSLLHEDVLRAAPVAPPREAATPAERVCVFALDGQRFALPLTSVREIAMVDQVTPVPRATACVLGAITLRGTLVSLVSIEALLGLTPRAPRRVTRAVVLAHPTMRVAVAVDEAVDMTVLEDVGPVPLLDASTLLTRLTSKETR